MLLFEFADRQGNRIPLFFEDPIEIIQADSLNEVKAGIERIQELTRSGYYAAGYISYEAAPAFEPAFSVHTESKMPLLWFGIFQKPVKVQRRTESKEYQVGDWHPDTTIQKYQSDILSIKKAIENGDTYQVNYTIRLHSDFKGADFAFYRQLASAQDSNYCAYLNTGKYRILSASPELFFHWKDDEITTRPMKGTCKRGTTLENDQRNAQWLYHSEKNRAENVMIVDLLRNDLGSIAVQGSVQAEKLYEIEQYPTVWQMTSTVTAKTQPETTLLDVFTALFPCGSVTGAPKISTMKIITSLEDSPREVYCGAIGYITPENEAVFNVPIRTVVIDPESGQAEYGVGGGITWDSEMGDEYQEALAKAKLLTSEIPEFCLLESLRLEKGAYDLLERHLHRLKRSAVYFGFTLSEKKLRETLNDYAQNHPNCTEKVRVTVSKQGEALIEGSPLLPFTEALPVSLAKTPVSRQNPFLYHKTTNRKVYEEPFSKAEEIFDVLLWNEDGELTEFTIGNLVIEIDSCMYTPPVECGLLAGTLREELMETGKITERILRKKDLEQSSKIWLINSVRGWTEVYIKQ